MLKAEAGILALAAASSGAEVYHLDFERWGWPSPLWMPAGMQVSWKA